jgi:hypothetical protein
LLTLAVWDRSPDRRKLIQWSAGPRAWNLAEHDLHTFEFKLARQFYPSTDLGWFKQSIRSVFEAELEGFSERVAAKYLGSL